MKRIDDEIKSHFEDDYHRLVVNILFTNNWICLLQKDIFDPYDLTRQQYNILRILKGQSPNPVSINLIRERMLDKMSDASRIVSRLQKKGLVDCCASKQDKRITLVSINEKGMKLIDAVSIQLNRRDKEYLKSNLTEIEAQQLNFLLDKLRNEDIG